MEQPSPEDPYLWLEEVSGARALEWVQQKNQATQAELEAEPQFETLRRDLLAILDSDERIPQVVKRGQFYYNFWRDAKNERGVWRRTTWESYQSQRPVWDIVLDLDQLANTEKENWVWREAQLLRPNYERALVTLSRGGADADVTREFDIPTRQFVSEGFDRAESKGDMTWINQQQVFVATDFGPGSMTRSGYPRVAKRWTRGTPLANAEVVFEGEENDLSVSVWHDDAPGFERDFVRRAKAFYDDELYVIQPTTNEATARIKLDLPNSASKTVFHQYLACELREPWQVAGRDYAAGSLLVIELSQFLQGNRNFDVLFTPTSRSALAALAFTRDYLLLNVLEDVKNRIYVASRRSGVWQTNRLDGAPALGTISISPVDADESNEFFMITTDYVNPTTLWHGEIGQLPRRIKQLPAMYNADGLVVTQHYATSDDGTQIPYFMVARQDLTPTGDHPTLLYGYGGFEISLQPSYQPTVGRAWTSQGGVYVVANIRGGGEYGPQWHQAALQKNRPQAYADFAAVAQHLVERQITSARHLGVQGGSNGGLLVGNMVVRYPHLFHAAVCQVPLLDMRRFHRLLAGASWMAEYGNPDLPEEWEFIRTYSPYHLVQPDQQYPAVLFTTSTRDDRVHPGHARKMMARMSEQGHDVLYYENVEGGHGGAANNRQTAYMQSLAYTFLRQRLWGAAADRPNAAPP